MNDNWHARFLELAKHIASWSKDPSTQVGAVVVDPSTKNIVGTGYNGFSRGMKDSPDRYLDRDTKLKFGVHAEANAILNAQVPVKGCFIYIWPTIMDPACCNECAKLIVQSGIEQVYYYKEDNLPDRWKDKAEISSTILNEGNVGVYKIDKAGMM